MNFNHLHYFYMVVRHGSISAASRTLRVSQPSLSAQIKTFESSLGLNLFDRRGNKLALTPAGKIIYGNASQMFEISASISEFVSKSTHNSMPLHLGIAEEIERPFAVSLVKHLTQKWKEKTPPSISFATDSNAGLVEKLRSWHVDAVVTNRPTSYEDLTIAGSMTMPIYFAASKSVEPSTRVPMLCSAADIGKIKKAMNKGLAVPSSRLKLREEIDNFNSRQRQNPAIAFESDTLAP